MVKCASLQESRKQSNVPAWRRRLSARSRRLRPQPARSALAGRRPRRAAVRDELRGGRGERDPARRSRRRRRSFATCSARSPGRGQRHMNVESMFEYGSRAGFWRLWRMFTARKIPVTVFGVASALARNPQCVAGHARSRLGDRLARPEMDRLQGFLLTRTSAPICARRSASTSRRPASGRSAGIPGGPPRTRSSSCSTTAAFSIRPIPMPTICLIG